MRPNLPNKKQKENCQDSPENEFSGPQLAQEPRPAPRNSRHNRDFFFLFVLLLVLECSYQASAHSFIYGGCSREKFVPGIPFESHLHFLLSTVASSATTHSYKSFAIGNSSSLPAETTVYGLYQCRRDLNQSSCISCIEEAVIRLGYVCPEGHAGSIQMEGCFVRYDNLNFLGKLDVMKVYQMCSPITSSEDAFVQLRDNLLDDFRRGFGFRSVNVGRIQGFAECQRDLTLPDCIACLEVAVQTAKSACESSVAGDVFLGKCYVRYWASGYSLRHPTDAPTDGKVVNIVGIVLGILAGVALLTVLFFVLRKVVEYRSRV